MHGGIGKEAFFCGTRTDTHQTVALVTHAPSDKHTLLRSSMCRMNICQTVGFLVTSLFPLSKRAFFGMMGKACMRMRQTNIILSAYWIFDRGPHLKHDSLDEA